MKRIAGPTGLFAAIVAIACGVGFIVDCRSEGGKVAECWVTGQGMINRAIDLAAGAAVGGVMGFWTLNPALHKDAKASRSTEPAGDEPTSRAARR
jgi:hypothetical protein